VEQLESGIPYVIVIALLLVFLFDMSIPEIHSDLEKN